ncbi:MAG: hypothetical protein K8Q97_01385 [Candidatus Andersenbacteria bacterium]|nr:hypothetical protein [Candidatus Andersenbacteria bacterium]
MKKPIFKIFILLLVLIGAGMLFASLRSGNGTASVKNTANHPVINAAQDAGALFSKDASVPFQFSTGNLTGTITQHAISPAKDADYILAHYKACGPKYRPASYFPEMASTMKKLPETAYSFGSFQIVLIPNLLGYKNFPAIQEDFFSCPDSTGTLVSAAMNDNWLVFTRSCASGDQECAAASAVISPTIQVK